MIKNRICLLLALVLCGLALTGCKRKTVLHIYTWSDYFSPTLIQRFEKENDCVVMMDIFDSNEMMFAKLQAGGTGYDIIVPTHYFIGKMVNEGMIQKLDKSRLPNLQWLDPEIVSMMNPMLLDYCVPYFMSYTGLGYNKEKLPNFEPSWSVFENPELAGRMTLLDDYTEVLGALGRYLGYTAAELDDPVEGDARMEKLVELGLKWRKNVIKFENEQYKNGLSAGEFLVTMGYFSDLSQAVDEQPETLGFVMPKEGPHELRYPRGCRRRPQSRSGIQAHQLPPRARKRQDQHPGNPYLLPQLQGSGTPGSRGRRQRQLHHPQGGPPAFRVHA